MLVIMRTKRISLGGFQFEVLSTLERLGKQKFTVKTVSSLFPGASRSMILKTLSKLAKKGRVYRIKRGNYRLVPLKELGLSFESMALVPDYFDEGYVSFLAAMQYYGWTTQLPSVVHVVTPGFARPAVFQGVKFIPVRISKRFYAGYTTLDLRGVRVEIALKEKLVLDCLSHPEYCNGLGELCKALKYHHRELNWTSMRYFLDRMGNSAVERRLYYCLNFLGLKKIVKLLGKKTFSGYRRLDASLHGKGKFDSKSGLLINVDLNEEML